MITVLCLVILAVFCARNLILAWSLCNFRRGALPLSSLTPSQWPKVLVQLPLYNEPLAAWRLVQAVLEFDYPLDRLEIQILDDSTNGAHRQLQERIQSEGLQQRVRLIHRDHREGFKAGALQAGVRESDAEMIALFDSDFLPKPGVLKQLVTELVAHPSCAFVQAKWGYLNRGQNLLTRLAAVGLDYHFMVEQGSKADSLPTFNGTAGVIRRRALDAIGGWNFSTVTEDLDLSYRLALAGWRGRFYSQLVADSEIPSEWSDFVLQQRRWLMGSVEVCKSLFWQVLTSSRFALRDKIRACLHLLHSTGYMAAQVLFFSLVASLFLSPEPSVADWSVLGAVFSLVAMAVYFLWLTLGISGHPVKGWRKAGLVYLMAVYATGLTPSLFFAAFTAWMGVRKPFFRTPKRAMGGHLDSRAAISTTAASGGKFGATEAALVGLSMLAAWAAVYAWEFGNWPLLMIFVAYLQGYLAPLIWLGAIELKAFEFRPRSTLPQEPGVSGQ